VNSIENVLLREFWASCEGPSALLELVDFTGQARLSSRYPVAELAAASVAVAGLAIAEYAGAGDVLVDRQLAAAWFGTTLRPQGWSLPQLWDDLASDYRCLDGWVRLHTNDPRHRAAALNVLGLAESPANRAGRPAVAALVARWTGGELESAIVAAGGCAAELRSPEQWRVHPQGVAVAAEPLLARHSREPSLDVPSQTSQAESLQRGKPLEGLRVLDLTRVLAGPAATRLLAGFGAEVLRIDPLDRDEPSLEGEMTLGKACARLDLKGDPERLLKLLSRADVLVHGYRPDALDGLGLDEQRRRSCRPGLVEVALDAYGWTGPWRWRRGSCPRPADRLGSARTHLPMSDLLMSDPPNPVPQMQRTGCRNRLN
jgi:hypothetical protein